MHSTAAMPDVFTVQDMASYLQISPATVQRWCRQGLLPAAKIGKEYRIRAKDFEQWYDSKFVAAR